MARRREVPALLTVMSLVVGLALQMVEARLNAIYVLGDSTVDVGNNNYLNNTHARADVFYYGIDFPGSTPTGRFSNGFNIADVLAKLLGFPMSPPAFLSIKKSDITKQMLTWGINFASGGSGLLDQTGKSVGGAIPMRKQIEYFSDISRNITMLMGKEGAEKFLANSLILISTGSNDMFEYSFSLVQPDQGVFLYNLTSTYMTHLRDLYELGGRKFGIIGIPMIGCCPSQRARNDTGACYEELNDVAQIFHNAMELVLRELQIKYPEFKYALGNSYEMVASVYENPMPFNLKELQYACCGSGAYNGESQCNATDTLCANRNEFFFWDWYHPTQVVSVIAAKTLYSAGQKLVAPVNFKQLAEDVS